MGEAPAREEICGLLARAGIIEGVAGEKRMLVPISMLDELNGALAELLVTKTYTSAQLGGLDLSRIAGGESVCGWARQLLRRAAPSKARDIRRVSLHEVHIDLTVDDPPPGTETPDAAGVLRGLKIEVFLATQSFADPRSQAEVLRLVEGLPPARRPPSALERYRVRRMVEAKPLVAGATLAYHQVLSVRESNPLLTAMWADYTADDIATVLGLGKEVSAQAATLIVTEQVWAPTYPSRPFRSEIRTAVVALSRRVGWQAAARALLHSYFAISTGAPSVKDVRTSENRRAENANDRHELALAWPQTVFNHLEAFPMSPLGASLADVESTLDQIYADVALRRQTPEGPTQ